MYQYVDDMGIYVDILPVEKTNPHYEWMRNLREELILNLAETNEELGDKFLGGREISAEEIVSSIRHTLRTTPSVALHCGAALKNWGI